MDDRPTHAGPGSSPLFWVVVGLSSALAALVAWSTENFAAIALGIVVAAPCWLLLVVPLLLAAAALLGRARDWRRGRLRSLGRCGCCGYDLSGAAGPVCPECGEAAIRGRSVDERGGPRDAVDEALRPSPTAMGDSSEP